jgi:hypothetical protein
MPTVTRKSVPLTDRDLDDLARVLDGGSPVERAFVELLGAAPRATEAATLQAVFRAGLIAIDQQIQTEGYAELARSYEEDPDERAYRDARRKQARFRLAGRE